VKSHILLRLAERSRTVSAMLLLVSFWQRANGDERRDTAKILDTYIRKIAEQIGEPLT